MAKITYRHYKNGKISLLLDSKFIGYIRLIDRGEPSPYISELITKESHRNLGYGKLLMEKALSLISGKIAVSLFVGTDNLGAIRFYQRFGFFIAYSMERGTFYCMTKKL